MKQPNYKKKDPTVVEIFESGFKVNLNESRDFICYPIKFYGMEFSIQPSKKYGEVSIHLDRFPNHTNKREEYKEIKESQHITQNGCWCKKCDHLTRWFTNYMKRQKYAESRHKKKLPYNPRNHGEKNAEMSWRRENGI